MTQGSVVYVASLQTVRLFLQHKDLPKRNNSIAPVAYGIHFLRGKIDIDVAQNGQELTPGDLLLSIRVEILCTGEVGTQHDEEGRREDRGRMEDGQS